MADNLKNMDVDALLTLRGDVERMSCGEGRICTGSSRGRRQGRDQTAWSPTRRGGAG